MSPRERVVRTQRELTVAVVVIAGLAAVAVSVAALATIATIDWLVTLDRPAREAGRVLAMFAGVSGGAWVVRRGWGVRSVASVALWIEERRPALRFALVTAVDPTYEGRVPAAERVAAGVSWDGEVRRSATRAARVPVTVLAAAFLVWVVVPGPGVQRTLRPTPGDVLTAGRGGTQPLGTIVVSVIPPAYSGLRASVYEQPVTVPALEGSAVEVSGRGTADRLSAVLNDAAIAVAGDAASWIARFHAPGEAAALRLVAGDTERLVAIEGRPDLLPVVVLSQPARDTVYRVAPTTLALAARARDDFGIAALWFEYIVSSGQGESFRFRSGTIGRTTGVGHDASAAATFRLDSIGLGPGDVLHLRAVARDNRAPAGDRLGESDTRTLRVARPDEYDSVSVALLPTLVGDTSALSQRLLIMLAEALEQRRPRLDRAVVVSESRAIGLDQARLRRRVAEVVFMRLGEGPPMEEVEGAAADTIVALTPEELLAAAEAATGRGTELLDFHGDETPVVAVNRPLLEAYNAMWGATRELELGEPGRALPHMRAALEAIQRARAAERIYLRGRAPTVVLDLSRVRLAGRRDDAEGATRSTAAPVAGSVTTLSRFQRALDLLADPAAADSLLLLRIDVVGTDPAAAAALGDAVTALRTARDPLPALARARHALAGGATVQAHTGWSLVP